LDEFPEDKQGTAMTLFGLAAIIAPILGPTLGGWLCVNYSWRWIFLINVPIGLFALVGTYAVVDDPEYLKKERSELSRKPLNVDYIGLSLLVLAMCCWEILLSKGREWDWLADPFGRSQTLLVLFVIGLVLLIVRRCSSHPMIDFPLPRRAQFRGVLHHLLLCLRSDVLRAWRFQSSSQAAVRIRRTCLRAGVSPSGITSMAAMVIAGILLGRQFDAWLMAAGLAAMAAGNYWMVRMNLQISFWHLILPRMLLTLGLGLIFAPPA
jgi:DHA2 family multidrug resistance protein